MTATLRPQRLSSYDQRIRLEGYGIEWMMNAAGMNAPVAEQRQTAAAEPFPAEEMQG